jgi:hypothetical protein
MFNVSDMHVLGCTILDNYKYRTKDVNLAHIFYVIYTVFAYTHSYARVRTHIYVLFSWSYQDGIQKYQALSNWDTSMAG